MFISWRKCLKSGTPWKNTFIYFSSFCQVANKWFRCVCLWPLYWNFVELANSESSPSSAPVPSGCLWTPGLLTAGLGQMHRIPLVLLGSAEWGLRTVPYGVACRSIWLQPCGGGDEVVLWQTCWLHGELSENKQTPTLSVGQIRTSHSHLPLNIQYCDKKKKDLITGLPVKIN